MDMGFRERLQKNLVKMFKSFVKMPQKVFTLFFLNFLNIL